MIDQFLAWGVGRDGPASRILEAVIDPVLLEITNGILLAVLACVTIGAFWNLLTIAYDLGRTNLREFHRIAKPSIALTIGFGGLLLRVVAIWIPRHLGNQGRASPDWIYQFAPGAMLFGTLLAAVGLMCWLRLTLPDWFGVRGWLFMLLCVIAFGVLMAL